MSVCGGHGARVMEERGPSVWFSPLLSPAGCCEAVVRPRQYKLRFSTSRTYVWFPSDSRLGLPTHCGGFHHFPASQYFDVSGILQSWKQVGVRCLPVFPLGFFTGMTVFLSFLPSSREGCKRKKGARIAPANKGSLGFMRPPAFLHVLPLHSLWHARVTRT